MSRRGKGRKGEGQGNGRIDPERRGTGRGRSGISPTCLPSRVVLAVGDFNCSPQAIDNAYLMDNSVRL